MIKTLLSAAALALLTAPAALADIRPVELYIQYEDGFVLGINCATRQVQARGGRPAPFGDTSPAAFICNRAIIPTTGVDV